MVAIAHTTLSDGWKEIINSQQNYLSPQIIEQNKTSQMTHEAGNPGPGLDHRHENVS